MSNKLRNNQVNNVINSKILFDSNYSISNDSTKYHQPVVTFSQKNGKKSYVTYVGVTPCL